MASERASSAPLMDDGREGRESGSVFGLDLKEAKQQILFSLPMILTNVCYYLIPLVSVMFAGHLGDLSLAGAALANSWATVSGVALMVGLSGALETLCGQGFGAKLYGLLGLYLQASCIISFLFSVLVSVLWFYTEPVLIFLRQEPEISKAAALFLRYLIPGLFAYGLLQNILRFLQTQSVVMPLVFCSLLPLLIHLGIVYALVHWAALGFIGAPLAASISMWVSFLMLAAYVIFAKKFKHTWNGFSLQSFSFVLVILKLGLPSAAMVCLEYWAFEILVLLAGLMPSAEHITSLVAIWIDNYWLSLAGPLRGLCLSINTESIAYMITYGLSAAASTRVSNELGAGCPDMAKKAMGVTVRLSVLIALAVVVALASGHNIWSGLFSDNTAIIRSYAKMTPLVAMSIIFDAVQGVLSGVARGCGWQHLAVYANLGTFYLIGMPVACLLSFVFKLYAKGLWIGLICGLAFQAGTLLLITLRTHWSSLELCVCTETPLLV